MRTIFFGRQTSLSSMHWEDVASTAKQHTHSRQANNNGSPSPIKTTQSRTKDIQLNLKELLVQTHHVNMKAFVSTFKGPFQEPWFHPWKTVHRLFFSPSSPLPWLRPTHRSSTLPELRSHMPMGPTLASHTSTTLQPSTPWLSLAGTPPEPPSHAPTASTAASTTSLPRERLTATQLTLPLHISLNTDSRPLTAATLWSTPLATESASTTSANPFHAKCWERRWLKTSFTRPKLCSKWRNRIFRFSFENSMETFHFNPFDGRRFAGPELSLEPCSSCRWLVNSSIFKAKNWPFSVFYGL